ncbi:ISLre2 family transposase [Streptococcus sp. E17BB]|uniref:ISLre2 family transposase n=1 Tax=Streptococcus sp. E17BB TaxID=3278714 RepID=UPI00359D518A
MVNKVFDEASLFLDFQKQTVERFLAQIAQYDEEARQKLVRQGYKLNKKDKRTVLFTFGEVTFYRNRWTKNGQTVIPVDEFLGLEKYSRYSKQLVYEVARIATYTSYRKVVDIMATTYKLTITKSLVCKALKEAGKLLEERDAYRFYEEANQVEKIKADIIYTEGDGVLVKVIDENTQMPGNMELSHFMVHTGSKQVSKDRFVLENKKTFVGDNNQEVRQTLQDYIHNHFEITEETLLVSNSDHGSGYTPYIFKELAKSLGIKKHEHFWDRYHLNLLLDHYFKTFSEDLRNLVYQGISQHDKSSVRLALNTAESLIDDVLKQEEFGKFAQRLLRDFSYTKPPHLRGLPKSGIGVMETQHRKLTYRMKKQGKYWSETGAVTMSKLILLNYENQLKELFFGDWREVFEPYRELEALPVSYFLKDKTSSDYYLKGKYHGRKKL